MTEKTEASTKPSEVGRFVQVKAINYAYGIAEMVKEMNRDNVRCELSREGETSIKLVLRGVTIGDDGKFVEVEHGTN